MLAYTLFEKSTQFLSDLFYPPRCVNCDAADSWLCDHCCRQIPLISSPVCERCGTPFSKNLSLTVCKQCNHNPLTYIDGLRAAAYFENNPLRPAIHCLKYRNNKAIASVLGQILVDAYQRFNMVAEMIVPVPLHSSRLRGRGYNQSELVAKQMGKLLHLPVNMVTLQRIRKTESQMELGAEKRHQNVANAFACQQRGYLSQHILLVDDVCTTGATLDACAQALKESGVASVWGITLAKAR